MNVEWWGLFDLATGYSVASNRYPVALIRQGIPTAIRPFNTIDRRCPLYNLSQLELENPVRVVHHVPVVKRADAYFTVFEFDRAPDEWIYPLKDARVVMTQSEFSRESLSSVCEKDKIHLVRFLLDDSMHPDPDATVGTPYVFLSVFEWTTRKIPEMLVEAFCRAFEPSDPVELWIRAWSNEVYIPYEINKVYRKLGLRRHNIRWLPHQVSKIADLYRRCDAYVSVTAGEAWGATLCEAMACGKPTIGCANGGNQDFMTKHNSFLVEADDWSEIGVRGQQNPWVKPNFRWRLPIMESFVETLRKVYSKRRGLKALGRRASKTVWEMCNENVVGQELKRALGVFE